MKNHFFIPYFGNKRQEVSTIYDFIEPRLNKIEYIIEPFAGTSALSYYIAQRNPKKFKYILNDNNDFLVKLYSLNDNERIKLRVDLLELKNKIKNKEDYDREMVGWERDFIKYIFANKIYNIRPGLYPMGKVISDSVFDSIMNAPIKTDFLDKENVKIYNKDALEIYNEFKGNKKALIFLDPPYLSAENSFYKTPTANIYEYLFNNDISKEKAYIVLCLANIWIIKLLFKGKKSLEYDKKYETTKKNIKHIVISNEK